MPLSVGFYHSWFVVVPWKIVSEQGVMQHVLLSKCLDALSLQSLITTGTNSQCFNSFLE